jgi:hypothetical protein
MTSTELSEEHRALKGIRRAAVWTIIVSLVVAALIGIATIVSGEFGDLQAKVLLTTLAVAGAAILALCHLAVLGRDVKVLGWIGIGTSAITLTAATTLIWWNWNDTDNMYGASSVYMNITKLFAVSLLLAVSFAHANLMLLLANAPFAWMRVVLDLNLVLIGIVPLLVIPVILSDGSFPPQSLSDMYWRFFGVVLILDALGTVALPVITLIVRGKQRAVGLDPVQPSRVDLTLRGARAEWVGKEAAATKVTPLAVIEGLVDKARKAK